MCGVLSVSRLHTDSELMTMNIVRDPCNDVLRQRLEASETERRNVQAQLNATLDRVAALLPAPSGQPGQSPQPRPLGRRILAWLARQQGGESFAFHC